MHRPDVDALLDELDSRQWSEWMAYDRVSPPDLWESTAARLLYALACAWSGKGKSPKFSDFLPPGMARPSAPPGPIDERAVLAGFGISPPRGPVP